jgi:ankyrin repeat protein
MGERAAREPAGDEGARSALADFKSADQKFIEAVQAGHISLAKKALADKANPNARGADNQSAMNMAIEADNAAMVGLLLRSGADGVGVDPVWGCAPLHLAAHSGQLKALRELLARHKAGLDERDERGRTPLMLAAVRGHAQCVEALVSAGAAKELTCMRGATAIIWASQGGSVDCARALATAGAHLDARDQDKMTALARACNSGALKMALFLLDLGADPLIQDRLGREPEQIARERGYEKMASAVAKVSKRHKERQDLHAACKPTEVALGPRPRL